MCGRFTLFCAPEELQRIFDAPPPDFEIRPSYNVAPTQTIPVLVGREGGRHFQNRHWGLVPFWAKDISIGARMINARVETLAAKPAFKAALKSRRCLIPANGFYEWKGPPGNKQPYYFHAATGEPFAFAGLYETWQDREAPPGQGPYKSCAIVTTEAVGPVREVHRRMPVILPPEAWSEWLDPEIGEPERALKILAGSGAIALSHYPVSRHVNQAANNSPECLNPLEEPCGAAPQGHTPGRTGNKSHDGIE